MRPEHVLRSITELIVRSCDPDVVLLFGSYAKGQENEDSDLDILVVGKFRESRYFRGRDLREALRYRYPLRIDFHLFTPEELAVESGNHYGFPSTVCEHAVPLYKKPIDIPGFDSNNLNHRKNLKS